MEGKIARLERYGNVLVVVGARDGEKALSHMQEGENEIGTMHGILDSFFACYTLASIVVPRPSSPYTHIFWPVKLM